MLLLIQYLAIVSVRQATLILILGRLKIDNPVMQTVIDALSLTLLIAVLPASRAFTWYQEQVHVKYAQIHD